VPGEGLEPSSLSACDFEPACRQAGHMYLFLMVGEEGLEPSRCCHQWILSPSRIPFRHSPILKVMPFHKLLTLARFKPFLSGSRAHPVREFFCVQKYKRSVWLRCSVLTRIMLTETPLYITRNSNVDIISFLTPNYICTVHPNFEPACRQAGRMRIPFRHPGIICFIYKLH
jgi:hypothetical protein